LQALLAPVMRFRVGRARAAAASLVVALSLSACGGGSNNTAFSAANVQGVTVGPGPANNVNLLFTTVTICTPGSASSCQSVDHVLVDTGSTGLRLLSSLFPASLFLRQQTDSAGNPLVECGQFASGYTWGPVKLADVRIAQELARSTPIQLINDPVFPAVPSSCSSIGPALDTAAALGANGVLGVGVFEQDCGALCAQNIVAGTYYVCPSSGCRSTQASAALQLQNPVRLFASANNNGVIIDLPAVPDMGAGSVDGSLIFGIGTRANNGAVNVHVTALELNTGTFTTVLNNRTYTDSVIDSGSNALYFASNSFPACSSNPDFACPSSTLNLSAALQGRSGTASIVNFRVANAQVLFSANPTFFAFGNLAGTNANPNRFDWGLPLFFGRRIFIAIEGQDTPAGVGPYVAF
jgi:hypothetical protein